MERPICSAQPEHFQVTVVGLLLDAVGADAATLDGLPEARRKEFLDEFERDLPKNDPAPRPAPTEDASEINVDWERRVQFDALRDGNALRQNDVLN